jgi:hypothetical protein
MCCVCVCTTELCNCCWLLCSPPPEPIVRLALKTGKPFVVLPCCVFPNTNLHRKLPDPAAAEGEVLVRSYEQFVKYLRGLAPTRIHQSALDMEGRSVILWSDPNIIRNM